MPHTCWKVGWFFLILSVIVELAKAMFVRNMDVAWCFAKASHIIFIGSIILICLSKEKMEDEMISGFRLKSIGITAYALFFLLLVLSIVLEMKPGNPYLSALFLFVLPVLLFILYYGVFKWMLWNSKKL